MPIHFLKILQIDLALNMSGIAKKLSIENIGTILLELHAEGQSKMNQRYSYHDFYRFKDSQLKQYFIEPSLKKKIKTKNYNCYETNFMQQTNCLDEFYMSEMNCTFPWSKKIVKNREICGSKHYIHDFIDLIDVVTKGINIPKEVHKCLIPNCSTMSWNILRQETLSKYGIGKSVLSIVFDSGRKV